MIVELGANDMLRGLSPDIARRNLTEILTRLKARRIPVLLAGCAPRPISVPTMRGHSMPFTPTSPRNSGCRSIPSSLKASRATGR